jgi:hypothetical protein
MTQADSQRWKTYEEAVHSDGNWTVVHTFASEIEAHLARSRLEADGIPATVHRFSRYRAIASGGYTLRVSARDFRRAKAVLDRCDAPIDMDEYVDENDDSYKRCPACRSVNVAAAALPRNTRRLVILAFGIPLLFIKRDWACRKCGHTWIE